MREKMSNSLCKEQREQIWQIAFEKEKEALMEVPEFSSTNQMLDRKTICSGKQWHFFALSSDMSIACMQAVNNKVSSELANVPNLQTVLPRALASDMNTVCIKAEKHEASFGEGGWKLPGVRKSLIYLISISFWKGKGRQRTVKSYYTQRYWHVQSHMQS